MTTFVIILLLVAIVAAAIAYQAGRNSAARAPAQTTPRPTPIAEPAPMSHPPSRPAAARQATAPVTSWGYQLQKLKVAEAAASPFDLLVIDPAKDGTDDTSLTRAEVERLKTKPDGSRRLVIAYLSIGEAESYRGYWNPAWKTQKPSWLLAENPDWEENYAVCFWDPAWQAIMCDGPDARLDRILAAGFDGVYLDKCDVYEDMRSRRMAAAKARPDLEGDMAAFVTRLSRHAKAARPGFLVIMQNAEGLIARADLRRELDGSAKEELVFGVDTPEKRNSKEDFEYSRDQLKIMQREGKLVLVVEYLDNAAKIAEAQRIVSDLGFVLYISPKNRDLAKLVVPPSAGV